MVIVKGAPADINGAPAFQGDHVTNNIFNAQKLFDNGAWGHRDHLKMKYREQPGRRKSRWPGRDP